MMRTLSGATSSTNRCATGSSRTVVMRSSVDRMARESSERKTMETMKNVAILMPSGRSTMFAMVV